MYNKNEFILKEPKIQYGTWVTPSLITPAVDPATYFIPTNDIGYVRLGTIVQGLNDEFVEYLSGTPHLIVRKDLLRRNFTLKFTANQQNPTILQMLYNFDTETGVYTLAHIGHDAPVKARHGWKLTGQKVDGSYYYIGLYSGEIVTTDKSKNFKGTEHVDIPVEIQAFQHDDFITTPSDQRDYGIIWEPFTISS